MKALLVVLCIVGAVFSQEKSDRTIQFKNGDKISGRVISDNDSSIVLQTSFGEVTIQKSEIKLQAVTIYLKDGSIVSGDIVSKDEQHFLLRTSFGVVTINKENIERTSESGSAIPGSAQKEEFLYSHERLTDVFFDPTGYTLEKGSVYFSGLSWGVALSENIDISSSYWRYFLADLNIRPKLQIYKSGNIESENVAAVGFHFHSGGPTGKQRSIMEDQPFYDFIGNITRNEKVHRWQDVGTASDYFFWTEVFASFTHSYLKQNGQGRAAYHTGVSVILHKSTTMPRFWVAMESDITDRFKIIGQVYYDPFQPSYREMVQNVETKNPFNLDFGFVYAVSESFRLGIHYEPYILLFYFKI
jgi:hypothetical protein